MGRQNGQPFLLCRMMRITNINLLVVTDNLAGIPVVFFDKLRHSTACALLLIVRRIALRYRQAATFGKRCNIPGIQLGDQICALCFGTDKVLLQSLAMVLTAVCHHAVDLNIEPHSVVGRRVLQTLEQHICLQGNKRNGHARRVAVSIPSQLCVILLLSRFEQTVCAKLSVGYRIEMPVIKKQFTFQFFTLSGWNGRNAPSCQNIRNRGNYGSEAVG